MVVAPTHPESKGFVVDTKDHLTGHPGVPQPAADELAARELISDTIVVVFSDHGEEFSDHREVEEEMAIDQRGIYGIGHGHQLFQELLHVPFLIWHPEMAGRTVRSRTSLVDAVPSLMDWLQIPDTLHNIGDKKLAGKRYGSLDVEGAWTEERSIFSSGMAYGPEGAAVARERLAWGPGPRAAQALMLATRARALISGRLAPSVADVVALARPALTHRMALTFAARAEGATIDGVISDLMAGMALEEAA